MPKTEQTLQLEQALERDSRKKREYGCTEVTIGFRHNGHGDEIVDYMSMDAREIFRCYELKVSFSDLKSNNHLSWYGDYNYLVISERMLLRPIPYDNYVPPYVGILAGESLRTVRQAEKRTVSAETKALLKDSLLRSIYWRMEQYRDGADPSVLKQYQKEAETLKEQMEQMKQEDDLLHFNYEDYENWYQKNHQVSFRIDQGAKEERRQFAERKEGRMQWIAEEKTLVCPVCHHKALYDETGAQVCTAYCPWCGADLRDLKP